MREDLSTTPPAPPGEIAADAVYLVPLAKYDALFSALVRTKSKHNIKNTAVAFMWLIDRMTEVLKSVESSAGAASPVQGEEGGSSPSPRSSEDVPAA